MPLAFLEGCSDACGWMAAVICVLSFGSFGVPLRGTAKVDMHPLVMQSYKTIVCFLTCWLVLLLGEDLRWSDWGIASGLFWVPGATCGVYGIQNAGLAVAVGTWSSIIVLTSFFFGVFVFHERVRHLYMACLAFVCLILGLVGMSKYSAQTTTPQQSTPTATNTHLSTVYSSDDSQQTPPLIPQPQGPAALRSSMKRNSSSDYYQPMMTEQLLSLQPTLGLEMELSTSSGHLDVSESDDHYGDDDMEFLIMMGDDGKDMARKDRIVFFNGRLSLTRRQLGILAAAINGAWGGLNLIPMHYAQKYDGVYGSAYVISFATGALIVNTGIWILYFGYQLYQKKGLWHDALEALPKFHLRELWLRGLLAGLLYSVGNFTAILTVASLGQSIGYPLCQMQLFTSGCWGIFYYKEISQHLITKWFLSAALGFGGILLLAYAREGGGAAGH